jgi:hypothetical protein
MFPLLKFSGTNSGHFSSAGLSKGRHRKDLEEVGRMDGRGGGEIALNNIHLVRKVGVRVGKT